jgi:hypothetical protein
MPFNKVEVLPVTGVPLGWVIAVMLVSPLALVLWLVLFPLVVIWVGCCALLEFLTRRTFWWGPSS